MWKESVEKENVRLVCIVRGEGDTREIHREVRRERQRGIKDRLITITRRVMGL